MSTFPLFKTRFAPTPSGFLHKGNAASFVLSWAWARAVGGTILLRIDDLDAERMRPEYLDDIFRTLDWLGLDYDEGAMGVDDFLKNWSQHHRQDLYTAALTDLKNKEILYACTCSRKQIRELSPDGIYPKTCRAKQLDFNELETAWRIQVAESTVINFQKKTNKAAETVFLAQKMGDFIVRQKNNFPAYQLASVVDDVHFGINHIVRGEDLLMATAAQLYLATQLNLSHFLKTTFFHHHLVVDTEGGKLSKSKGAEALATWREAGKSPLPIVHQAAIWLDLPTAEIGCLDGSWLWQRLSPAGNSGRAKLLNFRCCCVRRQLGLQ
jgi:glutamyl/glutaminyl-tRNA synthetase